VTTTLKVVGSKELVATLRQAAKDLADMREGFDAAGEIVSDGGRSTAPRRTGRLAGSHRSYLDGGPNSAMVENTAVYAVPIHWGRPAHHIEPHPWLFKAAKTNEAKVVDALEHDAQRLLDQVNGA
jgi:hypothetical protein